MISLPDLDKMYEYETNYHLTLDVSRLGKLVAHYEAYKMAIDVPGSIVECGVFKGTSLVRFALFRELLGTYFSAEIIAFDIFGDEFPNTAYSEDHALREKWIEEAGASSISPEQLDEVFKWKDITNYELISGDVLETIPKYVEDHPELRISLLNIDIDFYESTTCCLEYLYDRVVPGGVILLDNYTASHGDTKSVDDFFKDKDVMLRKFPFALRPCYVIKG